MELGMKNMVCKCAVAIVVLMAGICCAETIPSEPDAYLDYIEANGSQYIDTGVNAETGLKARADLEWGDAVAADGGSGAGYGDDWALLDARNGSTRLYFCHLNHNVILCGYSGYYYTSTVLTRKTRYEVVTDFSAADASVLQVYLNGSKICSDSQVSQCVANGNLNLNLNLYLFAMNYNGSPNYYARGKLYGLKIMKKNAETGKFDMIRNFVPCLKGGRAGLYDTVEGKIYFSATATDFAGGEVLPAPCEYVAWIESRTDSGDNYIDTGVWGRSGVKSEVDCSIRSGFASDQAILACRTSSGGTATRFFLAYFYSSYFGYGYKNGYWGSSGGANQVAVATDANARYLIKSELSAGFQSVTVNGTELHKGDSYVEDDFDSGTTLTLFGIHTASDNSVAARSNVRLYSAKIWDGDEIMRDFVPCIDDSGQAGLYDRVTRRMFKSKTAYDLATQVGACTNSPAIPAGVQPDCKIEYIESDGANDYFDLEVAAKDGVEIETVMEWVTVPTDHMFVGASDGTNRRFYLLGYSQDSKFYLGYVADIGKSGSYGAEAAQTGVKYYITSRIDGSGAQFLSVKHMDGDTWAWDGESGGMDFNYVGPFSSERSLYLFARNNGGTADLFTRARVYRLKIREKRQDGTYELVRDLVPCKYDGKPMLYDKISERFFQKKGNGRYYAAGGGAERPWQVGCAVIIR